MSFNFTLFMDVSILVLLAATVFLAFRLTMSLKNFKESRAEMEGLVNRLTGNIDNAERAIGGMQNAARTAGKELDEIISEAKALSDELKFMSQSGDSLANRLEKLADRNRELVEKIESGGGFSRSSSPQTSSQMASKIGSEELNLKEVLGGGGFRIKDREFQELDDDAELEAEFEAQEQGGFQSQAERELYEALQNPNRKARAQ